MMKFNFLVLSILKKRKLCKFCITMFSIMIFLYIGTLGLTKGIENKYNNLKFKNINHNYIVLKSNKSIDEMENDIKNVKYVYNYYPVLYTIIGNNELYYIDNTLLNFMNCKSINSKFDIIVPWNKNDGIKKNLKMNYNNKQYDLRIIDTYKSFATKFSINNNINNPIIVSKELIYEFIDKTSLHEIIVRIDDYDNLDKFLSSIRKHGDDYDVMIIDENSALLNRVHSFYNNIKILSNVLIIFNILFITIINIVIIYDNKSDIAIMKSLGYSNYILLLFIILSSTLLLFISLIPLMSLLLILSMLFKSMLILNFKMFIGCIINFSMITFLVSILLQIKIKKISIIKLMKN